MEQGAGIEGWGLDNELIWEIGVIGFHSACCSRAEGNTFYKSALDILNIFTGIW